MSYLRLLRLYTSSDLPTLTTHWLRRPWFVDSFQSMEEHLDRKVGRIFRRLPTSVFQEVENMESNFWKGQKSANDDKATSTDGVVSTKDNQFTVKVNASTFKPEEVSVKVVGDRILVSAKQEVKDKDSYKSQEMYHQFSVPVNVDPDAITSRLSSNGELTIEAPMSDIKNSPPQRDVFIHKEESAKDS